MFSPTYGKRDKLYDEHFPLADYDEVFEDDDNRGMLEVHNEEDTMRMKLRDNVLKFC